MEEKKLNELNDEQLEKVSGGEVQEYAPDTFNCAVGKFTGFIKKYAESHIGEMLYFVSHDGDEYYYGQLRESFEEESLFSTERVQQIMCQIRNGVPHGGIVQISGDDYWIYRNKE